MKNISIMNGCMMICVAAAITTSSSAQDSAPLLKAHTAIALPGRPGHFDWMMVDSEKHRLLAAHPGAGTLTVYDLQTKEIKELETGPVNGVAVDSKTDKIFAGGPNKKIVVFNRTNLEKIEEIELPGPADTLAFNTKNGMLYVDEDDGLQVWVIDAKTDKIVHSVVISGAPEYVEYDPVTDRLYQNIKDKNTVQVINPENDKVESDWPTDPITGPHGLAIDSKTQRLFSAGKNSKMAILDMKSGKVLSTVDIGNGVDQIAFDPFTKRVYCACDGEITVVEETEAGAKVIGKVTIPKGAHTLAVDPKNHSVWISYSDEKASYIQRYSIPKR